MRTDTQRFTASRGKPKTEHYSTSLSGKLTRNELSEHFFGVLARLLGFGAVLGLLAFLVWGNVYRVL